MTRLFNDPRLFKEDMIEGFVAAYPRYLRRVPDASGVIANSAPEPGRVAVVIGGGSGHYPAFCGVVGEGLATAAVIGDVFTSPSGEQAYRVARAAESGAGVLFSFGNYSGDVLNFAMAESRLKLEGVDCRTVLVTDDVLSAEPAEREKRRGIAGGFYVFKIAGSAAHRGDPLDVVEAIARHANARTRSVGVAFAGCTIPGQHEPLFSVKPDQMEVGLGIHGEPGVRSSALLPAREIAQLMVDALIANAPPTAGSRAAVLVNGLGATKYEELFVLYKDIAPALARAGVDSHETLVGEFVTSLDMAGCSLTLLWLDDELQELHDATAITPAFTRIGSESWGRRTVPTFAPGKSAVSPVAVNLTESPGEAGALGVAFRLAITSALLAIEAAEPELARLDAATGDGDHGAGMVRGFQAAAASVQGFEGTGRQSMMRAGQAFMDTAGGASGALVGGWLVAIGAALPVDDNAVDAMAIGDALSSASDALARLGQAQPGDKTMLDTLDPFVCSYQSAVVSGTWLAESWAVAMEAAAAGMLSTAGMVSRRGRASRLGERSRGHQDAGATSMFYVLRSFGDALAGAGI